MPVHHDRHAADRRKRRSADPITALHYQLAAIRREARFDALVLVDETGCMVAGAGAWPVCEELAAYAPLLSDRSKIRRTVVGARVAAIGDEAESMHFEVDGQRVLLCGRGGLSSRNAALGRAALGVRRILGPAPVGV
ncbi:MAG: hypothetical protein U0271_06555 [Polyangiaceae bacterium]